MGLGRGGAKQIILTQLHHRLIPRYNNFGLGKLARDHCEDFAHGFLLLGRELAEVILNRGMPVGAGGTLAIEHQRICMRAAEPMVLLQIGHLLGVLAIPYLAHHVEPVGHGLTMLLLDSREVRGTIRIRHTLSVVRTFRTPGLADFLDH